MWKERSLIYWSSKGRPRGAIVMRSIVFILWHLCLWDARWLLRPATRCPHEWCFLSTLSAGCVQFAADCKTPCHGSPMYTERKWGNLSAFNHNSQPVWPSWCQMIMSNVSKCPSMVLSGWNWEFFILACSTSISLLLHMNWTFFKGFIVSISRRMRRFWINIWKCCYLWSIYMVIS